MAGEDGRRVLERVIPKKQGPTFFNVLTLDEDDTTMSSVRVRGTVFEHSPVPGVPRSHDARQREGLAGIYSW
jgi:hypothetical protein